MATKLSAHESIGFVSQSKENNSLEQIIIKFLFYEIEIGAKLQAHSSGLCDARRYVVWVKARTQNAG